MLISVHTMKPKPVAPVPVTFRALAVAWAKVARHYFTGERTTQAWVLAGITVLGSFVTSWLLVWFSSIQKEVSNSLIDKDDARFRAALWQFLLLVLGSSPLFALNRYLEDRFSLEWRRYMTEKALAKYFSGKAFFRLSLAGSAESAHAAHMDAGRRVDGERAVPNEQSGMVQPGLDNPDQRICNDIKSFTETSVTVCLVVIRNVSNSGRCRRRSLRIMPGVEHAFGTCAGIRQRRSEHGRGPSLVPAQWPSSPSCGRPRPSSSTA